jgi:hypothetical protein
MLHFRELNDKLILATMRYVIDNNPVDEAFENVEDTPYNDAR